MAEVTIPESGRILTWVEFLDSGNNRNVWAMEALADPGAYYGGFKEPRVIEFGQLVRALSDINGTYQGIDFSLVLSDNDRLIRDKLSRASTKFFLNRSLVVRMIDDISRRAGLEPRTIMRGLVADYRPLPDLQFRMSAQDLITRRFSSPTASINQVPKRLILAEDFPDCPPEKLGTPVPIIYGACSDKNEYPVSIGEQPKFSATGNVTYANVGAAGTSSVKYVVTIVGDEVSDPPWEGKNQQDERIIGEVVITDAVGPTEFIEGARYTVIEWDQPFGYATKIYGRYSGTASFRGGTFGYLAFMPRHVVPDGMSGAEQIAYALSQGITQAEIDNFLVSNPGDEGRILSAFDIVLAQTQRVSWNWSAIGL